MTHTYSIQGMTCGNCVAKVKSELLKLGDVLEADVQLQEPQATITMQNHIAVDVLQQAVNRAGHYTIAELNGMPEVTKSQLQTYYPLILVVAFVTGLATITAFRNGSFNGTLWMNYFMGGFFVAFSFFKLLDLNGFADSYSTYDLLAQRWRTYGLVYPFLELTLGLAYITGIYPVLTNLLTIVLMGFSSIGVIKSVLNKRKIRCACLGTVFNLPMTTVTIVEDLLMVVMAIAGILLHC